VARAIEKAQARREEHLGESLLDEMRRVQRKAWELLSRTEAEGDHRGSIVALREVRECLESLGEMLAKANSVNGGTVQHEHFDASRLTDEQLGQLQALMEVALGEELSKPGAGQGCASDASPPTGLPVFVQK
jgi:hypothetical protein